MGELTPMERAELAREFVNRMIITEDDLDNIIYEMSSNSEIETFLNRLADVLTD